MRREERLPFLLYLLLFSSSHFRCRAVPAVSRRRRHFFFGLALLLLAVFGLAALPDPHPHRLHAMSVPFQKNIRVNWTIHSYFIGYIARDTLARTPAPASYCLTAEVAKARGGNNCTAQPPNTRTGPQGKQTRIHTALALSFLRRQESRYLTEVLPVVKTKFLGL